MREGPWVPSLFPPSAVLVFPPLRDTMDVVTLVTDPPPSLRPSPGTDAWCDLLIEWEGNLTRFPLPITNELVEACLLNDQVSKEYLEPPQYHWLALVLLVIPLAGVLGNSLVCIAVWQERRLHNVTNFFLVSLALADLMVCLAVMPFGVLELFYGYWPFSTVVCTIWVTCDVLGCSASILHLCCISVGRYIGIRNPLRTRQRTQYQSRRSVLTRVLGVWLLASVISCPLPLLAAQDVNNVRPSGEACAINNRFFLAFGSIFAFYLPMMVMMVIYVLTVRELHKPPDLSSSTANPTTITSTTTIQPNPAAGGSISVTSGTVSGTDSGGGGTVTIGVIGVGGTGGGIQTQSSACSSNGNGTNMSTGNAITGALATTAGFPFSRIASAKANGSGSASSGETCPCVLAVRTARALNERRATKVLGVVFLLFFVCWSPFFVLNVLQIPLGSDFFPGYMSTGFLWLGYMSSTVNPLVYTVFNRVFRSTFWQLLTCRCGKRRRRLLYSNTIRGYGYASSRDMVSWSFRSTYRQPRPDHRSQGSGQMGTTRLTNERRP
ncbi:5-hydroxytryptamine receptor 2A-like [Varroa destructor]|uniref:G-protein coupled receptors family 1 profile domain-containing protein n=1 Tax=Varroa destructor TaxID=109461 RepID=A0A7M7J934_VARDE|nr:5-hydroxytryptamine receptor 2A-like [Varroa destructor]